jgi:hypothetical protein
MRVFLVFLSLLFMVSCVGTQVAKKETTVGFYSYQPVLQKIIDNRKAECEADEACKEPKALTQEDILGLITWSKNHLEEQGMAVIGIEAEKYRIWFEKEK